MEVHALQRYLRLHSCFAEVAEHVTNEARRITAPSCSDRDICLAPHTFCTAALFRAGGTAAPGGGAPQLGSLVPRLAALGMLEGCSNIVMPFLALRAAPGVGQRSAVQVASQLLQAALQARLGATPGLYAAALLLHLQPGAYASQWPWQVLGSALQAAPPAAAASSAAPGSAQPDSTVLHILLMTVRKAALLTWLHQDAAQGGCVHLASLLSQVKALLDLHQLSAGGAEVDAALLELDALALLQDDDGLRAAQIAASVRAALGVPVQGGGSEQTAMDQAGGPMVECGMAWLYLHSGHSGFRLLDTLFRGSAAAGNTAASLLLLGAPELEPGGRAMAVLAVMKLASTNPAAAHPMFSSAAGTRGSIAAASSAADAALALLAPQLGPLLGPPGSRLGARCRKLLVACGLLLQESHHAAATGQGAVPLWISPAVVAVAAPSLAEACLPGAPQVALGLLQYMRELPSIAGAGSIPPAPPVTAWFPVLLHAAGGCGNFQAAPVLAADILLRTAGPLQGGRGSVGQQSDGDGAAMRLLQKDCRWWLLVVAALQDGAAVVSLTRRFVEASAAAGGGELAAAPPGQEKQLMASIMAAAMQLQAHLQLQDTDALPPRPSHRHPAAAPPSIDLPEVGLLLAESLEPGTWAAFFGRGEGQQMLSWLLLRWLARIEAMPMLTQGGRAQFVRRVMAMALRARQMLQQLDPSSLSTPSLPSSLAELEAVLASVAGQLPVQRPEGPAWQLPAGSGKLPQAGDALKALGWRAAGGRAPADFDGMEQWQAFWAEAVGAAVAAADVVALQQQQQREQGQEEGAPMVEDQPPEGGPVDDPTGAEGGALEQALSAWLGVLLACRPHPLLLNRCTALLLQQLTEGGRQVGRWGAAALQLTDDAAACLLHWGGALLRWPASVVGSVAGAAPGVFDDVAADYVRYCHGPDDPPNGAEPGGLAETFVIPATDDVVCFVPGTSSDEEGAAGGGAGHLPPPHHHPHGPHRSHDAQPGGPPGGDDGSGRPTLVLRLSEAFQAAVEARPSAAAQQLATAILAQQAHAVTAAVLGAPGPLPLEDALLVFAGACGNLPAGGAQKLLALLHEQVAGALPELAQGRPPAVLRLESCVAAVRQLVTCLVATRMPGYQPALASLLYLHGDDLVGEEILAPAEQLVVAALLLCASPRPLQDDCSSADTCGEPTTPSGRSPPGDASAPAPQPRQCVHLAALMTDLEPFLPSLLLCPACRHHQGDGEPPPATGPTALAAWVVKQATTAHCAPVDATSLKVLAWRVCPHVKQQLVQQLEDSSADGSCAAAGRAAAAKLLSALEHADPLLWLQTPDSLLNAPHQYPWISRSTSQGDLQAAADVACSCLQDPARWHGAAAFVASGLSCGPFAAAVLSALSASCHLPFSLHQLQALQHAAAAAACSPSWQCQGALRAACTRLAAELCAARCRTASQESHTPGGTSGLLLPCLHHMQALCAAARALAAASPHLAATSPLHAACVEGMLYILALDHHPVSTTPEGQEALLLALDSALAALCSMGCSCQAAAGALVHRVLPAVMGHSQHAILEAAGLSLQALLEAWGTSVLRPPLPQLNGDTSFGISATGAAGGAAGGRCHGARDGRAGLAAAGSGGQASALMVARAVPVAALRHLTVPLAP